MDTSPKAQGTISHEAIFTWSKHQPLRRGEPGCHDRHIQRHLVPQPIGDSPQPGQAAIRELRQFVKELRTSLHGVNEQLASTIKNGSSELSVGGGV